MDTTDWTPATVRAHRDLTPTVREFELRPAAGVKPWTVGSHLDVRVTIDGQEARRSYSLIGDPRVSSRDGVYRIAVKRMEPGRGGSRFMWTLETGAEILAPAFINIGDFLRIDTRTGEYIERAKDPNA